MPNTVWLPSLNILTLFFTPISPESADDFKYRNSKPFEREFLRNRHDHQRVYQQRNLDKVSSFIWNNAYLKKKNIVFIRDEMMALFKGNGCNFAPKMLPALFID